MNTNQVNPQGNSVMPDPPPILSTKDLLYMEDMLSWNLNMVKKTHFFAGQCQDPLVKQTLTKTCKMHQDHYYKIVEHLNAHLNQSVTAQQQLKGAQQNAGIQQ